MNKISTHTPSLGIRKKYSALKAIPVAMKRIYSFLILVMICVLFSGGAVFISLYEIHENNEKFCDVLSSSTSVPAVKPTNPAKQPVAEATYQRYLRHLKLEQSLGC